VITFADPALEQAVRAAIEPPTGELLPAAVSTLSHLSASLENHQLSALLWGYPPQDVPPLIGHLTGIECLQVLTSLGLLGHSVSDLSPLAYQP
jgi:hypothetical protein